MPKKTAKPAKKAAAKSVKAARTSTKSVREAAKEAKDKSAKSSRSRFSLATLRKLNYVLALLYIAQAAAVIALADPDKGLYAIVSRFLARDEMASKAGEAVYSSASQHMFDLNIVWPLAAIGLVGALLHALAATRLRTRYETDVTAGVDRFRWVHYAVAGSIGLIILAIVVGVRDLGSLIMIAALGVISSLLAWRVEARAASRLTFALSVLAMLAPLLVIAGYVKDAVVYGNGLPGYIYALLGSILALLVLFVLCLFLARRGWRLFANRLTAELVLSVLGFAMAAALTWQLFAGQLQP